MRSVHPGRETEIKKARGLVHMLDDKAAEYERGYHYLLSDMLRQAAEQIRAQIDRDTPKAMIDDIEGRRYCPECKTQIDSCGDYCTWCGQRIM